jgi:hypothetical protein
MVPMYDALRASYRFRCPAGSSPDVSVRLSGFRRVERLEGPAHPAVYRVTFACDGCHADHVVLVGQDELDYAPFEPPAPVGFWDPLTGRLGGDLGRELAEVTAARLRQGIWPWSFWCSAEGGMRPGYPSTLAWVAGRRELVGVAVSCSTCGETSLNLVSQRHLDEPFFHDPVVGAVTRPVGEIAEIERFRAELWSASFDSRRTDLAA